MSDASNASVRERAGQCDLVMKGGITSGVVYPAAIAELQKTYSFRSIGGSSAGAIAAAATAAAELGERRGAGGFPMLAGISAELAEEGKLQDLFAPTRVARPAFELLLRLQRAQGPGAKFATAVGGLIQRLWVYVAAAVIVALLLLALLVHQFHPADRPALLGWFVLGVLVLFFATLGLMVGVIHRAMTLVTRHLPASFFGICTGMPTNPDDKDPGAGLTPWLHDKFQKLSGEATPLTFRHLAPDEQADDAVSLTVMTTDVSRARPVQLPKGLAEYGFSPEEFRRLFPADVVKTMEDASEAVIVGETDTGLRRLKDPRDLPVLVATRMSLSFPVLLSAVPWYTVHGDEVRRHWFSDGGISSNFPIHLFDAWVPRRPTLALSFLPAEMKGDTVAPADCNGEPPVPRHAGTASLAGFLAQILDTMQNWRDTLQSELPGFNERVEVVRLEEGEGGMNLTMPPAVINRLIEKGKRAGGNLGEFPQKWERHRFHRFHMTMRLLEQELGAEGSFRTPSMEELLAQLGAGGWPAQCTCDEQLGEAWGPAAAAQTKMLRELGARWAGDDSDRPTEPPATAASFAAGTEPAPPSLMRRTPSV